MDSRLGGKCHEAHQDSQQADDAEDPQDGRLRRVPSFVPERLQDELHGRQSGLREELILGKGRRSCGGFFFSILENDFERKHPYL